MIKNILLVDDDPIFHLITTKMIGLFDIPVNISTHLNGKLAIEYLMKAYNESDCFIVVLDINMHVMNGWDVLEELHSSQLDLYRNIWLYIVSSSTDDSDLEKSKQYPIVRKFYHKPLIKNQVMEILNNV